MNSLGRSLATATALAALCIVMLNPRPALGATPTGLTAAIQKDTPDGPLFAVASWLPDAGTTSYELQRAYIQTPSSTRSWITVTAAPALAADGRMTVKEAYSVGSGGVCYRVRTTAPAQSEFSAEACSPIPPTSSAPGAPNSGNTTSASGGRSHPLVVAGVILALAATAGGLARRAI